MKLTQEESFCNSELAFGELKVATDNHKNSQINADINTDQRIVSDIANHGFSNIQRIKTYLTDRTGIRKFTFLPVGDICMLASSNEAMMEVNLLIQILKQQNPDRHFIIRTERFFDQATPIFPNTTKIYVIDTVRTILPVVRDVIERSNTSILFKLSSLKNYSSFSKRYDLDAAAIITALGGNFQDKLYIAASLGSGEVMINTNTGKGIYEVVRCLD